MEDWPEVILAEVSWMDIIMGQPGVCGKCALSLALQRALSAGAYVSVRDIFLTKRLQISAARYSHSQESYDFMAAYDSKIGNHVVAPCTVSITRQYRYL